MPATQEKYLDNDLVVITELKISDISSSLPEDKTSPSTSERPVVARRLLGYFASVYAAIMIAALVVVHLRDQRRVGIQQFFISCAAGFYIICYQFLSSQKGMKQWFKRNGPTFRAGSITLAALVVSIPVALLLLAQTRIRSIPSLPKPSAITELPYPVADPGSTPTSKAHDKNASVPVPATAKQSIRTGLVSDVRFTSDVATAVVVVDLNQETQFEVHRISSPERIYVDLQNTRLSPALSGKTTQTHDRLLRAITTGEHEHQITRITLATAEICNYSVTRVPGSSQLRIELRRAQTAKEDQESKAAQQ